MIHDLVRRGPSAALAAALLLAGCTTANDPAVAPPAGGGGGGGDGETYTEATPPPVRHVFIIVLENKGYDETFGAGSPAPYLSQALPSQGLLLTQYFGTGHLSLDNYVAMVSGQGPNPQTQADCQYYTDFRGLPALGPDGQAIGTGCVYPTIVPTVVDQLEAAGATWKGYMEDMGNDLARDGAATCAHPALDAKDPTQTAAADDEYAARHNPFVYFHTIVDDQARCDAHVVPLTALAADLASAATTPNYVFITPSLCSDGHDAPCASGGPGGLASADAFLQQWVPQILASPAFRQDGLLIVTFDEAEADPSDPAASDASACCGEGPGPNSPLPGIFGLGGGRTGAVLLSRFIKPGTTSDTPYNHYSMLRSVENLFALPYLGYAGVDGLKAFGADVYNDGP